MCACKPTAHWLGSFARYYLGCASMARGLHADMILIECDQEYYFQALHDVGSLREVSVMLYFETFATIINRFWQI